MHNRRESAPSAQGRRRVVEDRPARLGECWTARTDERLIRMSVLPASHATTDS